MDKYTRLNIKPKTAQRLEKYAKWGDSGDYVINKILDIAESKEKLADVAPPVVKPETKPVVRATELPAKDMSQAGPDARVAAGLVGKWIPDGLAPGNEVLILDGGYRGASRPINPDTR